MTAKKLLLSATLCAALVAAILVLQPQGIDVRPVGPTERADAGPAVQPGGDSPQAPNRPDADGMKASEGESVSAVAAKTASRMPDEDPDLAFIRARLTDRYGSLEADFLMRVAGSADDWATLQATVAEHEALTGNDYRALLMKVGINARVIPAAELARLLDEGVMPPPGVAGQLVASGDPRLISVFAERGLVPDLNAPNPSSGRDALGTLVLNVSYAPARYDEALIRNHVETLVSLGALPDQALLDVLRAPNRSNVEHRIWLARALIDNGAALGPEHAALIRSIRPADVRRRFEGELLEAGDP